MQTLNLNSGHLIGSIKLPSSKSYANRALILASLMENSPEIINLPNALDVTHLVHCLKQIGLKIETANDRIRFLNRFPECEQKEVLELDVGDGGTTARFLGAMLLMGEREYILKLGGRLKHRPWQEFIKIAKDLGGYCELSGNLLKIKGPIKLPPVLAIDCSQTTQVASAFQLLTAGRPQCQVIPKGLHSSRSYWSMTEKMMSEFPLSKRYTIPFDWSSASYPMAFAALNHEIFFPDLVMDECQADSKFINLLKLFECVEINSSGIRVFPIKKQLEIEMDVSDCLDLVPTLAYFLSYIPGHHCLKGVDNLVHKESDRLSEIINLLKIFEKCASIDGSSLVISGKNNKLSYPVDLKLPEDHRMVMIGSLFLLQNNGGTVTPADAVKKSYPEFYNIITY